ADVGRVYVYENHRGIDGRLLMSIRHEWHSPAVAPASARPENQSFPYRPGFERWESELRAGSTIQGLLREFPGPERAAMEAMDIVSLVLVPIFTGQDWWGFMGFDECSRERAWLPAEVDALRAAAGTLGAAIRREHTDEQLREAEAKYRAIVEQLPVAIYI